MDKQRNLDLTNALKDSGKKGNDLISQALLEAIEEAHKRDKSFKAA